MYDRVKAAVESECPEVTVLENEEHPSIKGILTQKIERMPHNQLKFPKTGSFEVYYQSKLVYSKLKSGVWPNPLMVASTIRNIIDKVIEPKDFNISSTKTLLKKPEVPKFSKNRSEAVLSQTKRDQVPQTSHESKRNKNFSSTEQLRGISKEAKEEKKTEREENSSEKEKKLPKFQEIESPKSTSPYKEPEPLRKNNSLKGFDSQNPPKAEEKEPVKKQESLKTPPLPPPPSSAPNSTSNFPQIPQNSPPPESKPSDSQKDPLIKQPTLPSTTSIPPTFPTPHQSPPNSILQKSPSLPKTEEKSAPIQNSSKEYSISAEPYSQLSEEKSEKPEDLKKQDSSSSISKKSSKSSSSSEDLPTSSIITDSFKLTLQQNEGKHSKLPLKNNGSSSKTFKVSLRNKKLLKLEEEIYEVPPNIPQKLKLEILGQSSTGTYKGYILVSCEDELISCYEIVVEVQ
jgi:hypothetical protein